MAKRCILVFLCSVACLAPVRAQAEDNVPRHGALWVEPVWPLALAAGGNAFVSGGVNLTASKTTDVIIEAALTRKTNWYGCESQSSGFWLSAGWALGSPQEGFFWAPKLRYRRFDTKVGMAAAGSEMGCSEETLSTLPGVDHEVGGALDVGYRFRTGRLYVAVVAGLGLGVCVDCPGSLQTGALLSSSRRSTQPALYVNPHLVRVGFAF